MMDRVTNTIYVCLIEFFIQQHINYSGSLCSLQKKGIKETEALVQEKKDKQEIEGKCE